MCNKAEKAIAIGETPVGCVLVHEGKIIGRGMNDTNRSLNVCNIILHRNKKWNVYCKTRVQDMRNS